VQNKREMQVALRLNMGTEVIGTFQKGNKNWVRGRTYWIYTDNRELESK